MSRPDFTELDETIESTSQLHKQLVSLQAVRNANFIDIPSNQLIRWRNIPQRWKVILACVVALLAVYIFGGALIGMVAMPMLGTQQRDQMQTIRSVRKDEHHLKANITQLQDGVFESLVLLNQTIESLHRIVERQMCFQSYLLRPEDNEAYTIKLRECLGIQGGVIN